MFLTRISRSFRLTLPLVAIMSVGLTGAGCMHDEDEHDRQHGDYRQQESVHHYDDRTNHGDEHSDEHHDDHSGGPRY